MKNPIKTKYSFEQFVDSLMSEKDDGIIDLYLAENNIEMVKQDSLNRNYLDFLADKFPLTLKQVSDILFFMQKIAPQLGNTESIATITRHVNYKELGDYSKLSDERLTKNIIIFYLFSALNYIQKTETNNDNLSKILYCLPCNDSMEFPVKFRFYAFESILANLLLKFDDSIIELCVQNNYKLMVQKSFLKAKKKAIKSNDYDNYQKLKITLLSIESNLINKRNYLSFIKKELSSLSFINPVELNGLLSFLQTENRIHKIMRILNLDEKQKSIHFFMENLTNTICAHLNHGKIELPSSDIHLNI